ncbi:hypothetical protein BUALT_Bualt02G0133000 [Buddleja alternifolia]|uniref:ADF-H domain-containing protein n=1 Tax=Buddleja alternifolia TaxID=168488 RepID=A0AAV6Y159_9LAMI|nr:hypothetical protein BUALT_Bualt02G0133000 [Buddleja alternifolia]
MPATTFSTARFLFSLHSPTTAKLISSPASPSIGRGFHIGAFEETKSKENDKEEKQEAKMKLKTALMWSRKSLKNAMEEELLPVHPWPDLTKARLPATPKTSSLPATTFSTARFLFSPHSPTTAKLISSPASPSIGRGFHTVASEETKSKENDKEEKHEPKMKLKTAKLKLEEEEKIMRNLIGAIYLKKAKDDGRKAKEARRDEKKRPKMEALEAKKKALEEKKKEKAVTVTVTSHSSQVKVKVDDRSTITDSEVISTKKTVPNTASGMDVHDDCKLRFLELKAKRAHGFIVFKIEEKQKQVVVEKVGEATQNYEDFTASLSIDECRQSPDTSQVRSKKIYASSKDRFKRELDGIQVELQATDPTEMGLDVIQSRASKWKYPASELAKQGVKPGELLSFPKRRKKRYGNRL